MPKIQEDINKMYPVLKRYRNAIFHVQEEYWSVKWRNLILDDSSADKIHLIHKQAGIFLLKNLTNEFLGNYKESSTNKKISLLRFSFFSCNRTKVRI